MNDVIPNPGGQSTNTVTTIPPPNVPQQPLSTPSAALNPTPSPPSHPSPSPTLSPSSSSSSSSFNPSHGKSQSNASPSPSVAKLGDGSTSSSSNLVVTVMIVVGVLVTVGLISMFVLKKKRRLEEFKQTMNEPEAFRDDTTVTDSGGLMSCTSYQTASTMASDAETVVMMMPDAWSKFSF